MYSLAVDRDHNSVQKTDEFYKSTVTTLKQILTRERWSLEISEEQETK